MVVVWPVFIAEAQSTPLPHKRKPARLTRGRLSYVVPAKRLDDWTHQTRPLLAINNYETGKRLYLQSRSNRKPPGRAVSKRPYRGLRDLAKRICSVKTDSRGYALKARIPAPVKRHQWAPTNDKLPPNVAEHPPRR